MDTNGVRESGRHDGMCDMPDVIKEINYRRGE